MNVQAIWENGVFRPIQPISIKHKKLTIIVPDEEIEDALSQYVLSGELKEQAQAMLEKYQAILDAPLLPDHELPELNAEYQDRLDAIELRVQIRQEQNRPT